MKKLSIIGIDDSYEPIIASLMNMGAVELIENKKVFLENDRLLDLETRKNKTEESLEILEKYSTLKKPLFHTRRPINLSDYNSETSDIESFDLKVEEIETLSNRLNKVLDEINKCEINLLSLQPWVEYDIPIDMTQTKEMSIYMGVIPIAVTISELIDEVEEKTDRSYISIVKQDKQFSYLSIFVSKDKGEELLSFLKQKGFTQIVFKDLTGTPQEAIQAMKSYIEKSNAEKVAIEKEISEKSDYIAHIELYHDYLAIEKDREKVKSKFDNTARTFSAEGWVPVTCIPAIESELAKYKEVYYELVEPTDEEEPPILIQNSALTEPFETVTEMYALPIYRGVDPTKYLSFFYAMFFGIMLSDAGYGIIIALACYIIKKKYDLEGTMRNMIGSFFWCGVSTIFWGIMFGGWFGDFIPVAANTLFGIDVVIKPLWFNPLEDPTQLLIWSLIFGVVHLFFGMGIKAGMLIRDGKPFDAVCDVFSWYLVILGAGMYLAGGSISTIIVTIGQWMLIVGAVILLLTGGRKNKGLGKITGGLGALYNITSYLSDILSYARLLALGLATGVIAQVINMLGSMAGGGIIGAIVLLIAFVFGHTFNLALNALGSYVHSSRLQYIEFFGKFYEDGGDEFNPFKKDTKYIKFKVAKSESNK